MHTNHHTARCLLEQCGAHYVMTAVKDNCPNLLAELAGLDWELRCAPPSITPRTRDTDESRSEAAGCSTSPSTATAPPCLIVRSPFASSASGASKTGKVEHETVHGLTSVPPDQATSQVVLALVRGHWSIENRLHHVRDVSYDEDRCRVRTGHLPRNLACLTNLAISIVRLKGRFDSLPQAHRHYARRPQDAIAPVINPPKR